VALSTLSIIEDLNERQIEVVKRTTGPLLVVAGPGSGKTLAIVRE
jgi:superfamily I DNA/RNA helicase